MDGRFVFEEPSSRVLRSVIECWMPALTEAQVRDLWESFRAGEWGLAVETLCSHLYEMDAAMEARQFDDLMRVARTFAVHDDVLESQMRELVHQHDQDDGRQRLS